MRGSRSLLGAAALSSEESPAAFVYCGGCGNAIGESARFCPSCGIDQAQFADVAPASPPTEAAGAATFLSSADAHGAEAAPPAATAAPAASAAGAEPLASSTSSPATAPPVRPSPAGPGRGSALTSPWRTAAGQRRSAAWMYYALIAVGALILTFQHPVFLLVAIGAGLYSTYLFRGGRFVIWFW